MATYVGNRVGFPKIAVRDITVYITAFITDTDGVYAASGYDDNFMIGSTLGSVSMMNAVSTIVGRKSGCGIVAYRNPTSAVLYSVGHVVLRCTIPRFSTYRDVGCDGILSGALYVEDLEFNCDGCNIVKYGMMVQQFGYLDVLPKNHINYFANVPD